MTTIGSDERQVLLALADDEHLMGQRHTEWIGVAPFLEEDLAFASIGQDELGHAAMLYELLEPNGDADALAFGRSADEYRSCWLAEAACTEWSDALVRHFLYDEAEQLRWQQLAASPHERVRAIAQRALSEEVYHRRHAHALLDSLASEQDAQARLRASFDTFAPLAGALVDESQCDAFVEAVALRFGPWTLGPSAPRTDRGPDFDVVYARMREVLRLDPTAHW